MTSVSDMNERDSSMAEHPNSQFLVLGPRGEVLIYDSDAELSRASLLGLVGGFFSGLRAYDANGSRWCGAEVIAPYRSTFWTRLLANTFSHPRFSVRLVWQHDGRYELLELQDGICRAVDRDEDI